MVGLLGGKMNPNVAIILLTYLNSEERKRYPAQTIQGINQITLQDRIDKHELYQMVGWVE